MVNKQNRVSNSLKIEEMYDQKECYITAQLFLKNQKFTPYPDNNGGVHEAICVKHRKYSYTLMDELEKKHSLVFYARLSSFNHKERVTQ